MALHMMPKKGKHLFLAETRSRKKDLFAEIEKFDKIFGYSTLKDYDLEFNCYQTAYKWKDREFGLVIADEIHDSLTPAYSKFYFNNKYEAIIGLSATINTSTEYDGFTKGELLRKVAPVCFSYGLNEAQADEVSRELTIFVVRHELDAKVKDIQAGNKKKRFFQTERASYDYWDKQLKKSWYIKDAEKKKALLNIAMSKRNKLIYNSKAKVQLAVNLLTHIKGKTVVFGNSLDALYKVTPNTVSSRFNEDKNEAIRERFEKGKINVIGSFKKLKQGANLNDVDNCVMLSYYSTQVDLIQRIGRLRQNGKRGYVFIFVAENTQEQVWVNKMLSQLDNIKQVYCPDLTFCLKQYNKEHENSKNSYN